ncbi:MAG: ankyrin repeat domain-containing protein [Deltaproteobacteria bacterium]|nr:ankyrin repeat domain-containing protein [Deltaproteobacteria bacterium]
MSPTEAEHLVFPAAFTPAPNVDEERCAPASGAGAVPGWLRQAAEATSCSDGLRTVLAAFAASPAVDDETATSARLQDLLTAAALCDAVEVVERLLARGVDVNGRDACGDTALVAAASSGAGRAARRLLVAGADPDLFAGTRRWQRTPLLAATIRADSDLARVLIEAGADPNASTHAGRTVLMFAAATGELRLIALLLARGADPCGSDEAGLDAARVARAHDFLTAAALLGEKASSCATLGDREQAAQEPR